MFSDQNRIFSYVLWIAVGKKEKETSKDKLPFPKLYVGAKVQASILQSDGGGGVRRVRERCLTNTLTCTRT